VLTKLISRLTILPRWVIIIIDLLIIGVSVWAGYLLRFNFSNEEIAQHKPLLGIGMCMGAALVSLLITKSYAGIVRYTGLEDGIRILYTTALSFTISGFVNLVYHYNFEKNIVPYSVLFISLFASFLFLFYYRLIVKSIFSYLKAESRDRINVIVFGAGQSGMIASQIIESAAGRKYKVVAFVEDDPNKRGKEINGIKIYNAKENFSELVEQFSVKEIIIAIRDLPLERKNEIVDACLQLDVKVKSVPPVEQWVHGELSWGQIKEVNIEDLLGREAININNDFLFDSLLKKRICVTGAAGSIGSELCRQILSNNPEVLILVDQAESPLYDIEMELRAQKRSTVVHTIIADIANQDRIRTVFQQFKPHYLFHAAAYKHVPMMESNPSEAIVTNILGTKVLADLSIEFGVEKFVMVSTDKAVNPTSVMGCSKRVAEIYVQSLDNHLKNTGNGKTSFVTTRFGNVLGSNGSVIPTFKRQIQAGGPVTVTHPEITRFFMTISEASRLVLEAGIMGRGGEIFIFDMGKPIKIVDLARKMIRLSGLEPGKDIDIAFIGLRDGEKLYEELLNTNENTIPTHHHKILKAKVQKYDYPYVQSMIDLFEDLVNDKNELKMVALMKEIVPEFKSNYSRFEVLD
jgi:FlaA1/EpsC-like NDP-sugar epimerase